MVEEAVDQHPLADVEGRLHRFRGDLVRLDEPGLDRQRQAERQRDDDDQLDQPAGGALRLRDREFQAESSSESPAPRRRLLILRRGTLLGLPRLGRLSVRLGLRLGLRRLLLRPPPRPRPASASGVSSASASSSLGASAARGLPSTAASASSGSRPRRPPPPAPRPRSGVEISSSSMPQRRSATRAALPTRPAQVVELGPAHVAAGGDLEFLDLRRMQRERPLDADAEGLLADGEGLPRARALALEDDSLEDLGAAAAALDHLEVDAHAIARVEGGKPLPQLAPLDAVDDAAHCKVCSPLAFVCRKAAGRPASGAARLRNRT